MLSDRTCEKYKEWKKEQKHLKDRKKKIKRKSKKVTTDCIEEEKKAKTIIKIRYRKCEKNGKEKRIFKPKPISSIDLLFRRIKPSLEIRHQFLDPRHIHCFTESLPEIDLVALKEIAQQEKKKTEQKYLKRRKKKRKKKISEEEKAVDRKEETKLQENSAATANEESNETKEETTNGKITEKKKRDDEQITEKKRKKVRKKDKFWCKRYQKKIESESEDSECDSICSYDSEICLKGLALTVEDKKKIEENRQRVQSSSKG
ncbi:peptidyl-prolyl isomerase cwc27-like [Vespa crabro]|uniref:peptidyl-prolyl isomerase cwc27-like n=1 Tax=Vespa crabro TaxID=7445 RepID=UPI001F02FE34|nr:peptidyl-prolyl isomerase cwc27-like [Vespa crabro]